MTHLSQSPLVADEPISEGSPTESMSQNHLLLLPFGLFLKIFGCFYKSAMIISHAIILIIYSQRGPLTSTGCYGLSVLLQLPLRPSHC